MAETWWKLTKAAKIGSTWSFFGQERVKNVVAGQSDDTPIVVFSTFLCVLVHVGSAEKAPEVPVSGHCPTNNPSPCIL